MEEYENLKIEVIEFEAEDVITDSPIIPGGGDPVVTGTPKQ